MKVKDVMNKRVITCTPSDVISDVTRKLRRHNISGMPVVKRGEVVGIISESDVLGLLRTPEYSDELWLPSPLELIEVPIRELVEWTKTKKALEKIGSKPVARVMKHHVHTISPEESIEKASEMMTKHHVNRLPVVKGDKLVGIITRGDIITGLGGRI
ncbi:MAG: CBS domain-containing protein [Methanocellales archaeon]|nr:CBS domain-containing protein [Methanocellales archaeon]